MHKLEACRIAVLLGAIGSLAACSTSDSNLSQDLQPTAPVVAEAPGRVPDYCPKITLREGTSVLRKGQGDAQEYVASVTQTTRSCRVQNGELSMEVGVAGRVVPGSAAKSGSVRLPIRVAIVRGSEVLYSELGQQPVAMDPAGGAQDFIYVDRNVRLPEPTRRDLTVFVGFDEGMPKKVAAR